MHGSYIQLVLAVEWHDSGIENYNTHEKYTEKHVPVFCSLRQHSYLHVWAHKSPTTYFLPNSLFKVNVYWNEGPIWSEICIKFEKHSLKHYAYLR